MTQPRKAQRQTLSDLRPNMVILCLQCEQPKAAAGAVKFRAHLVCAECVTKLKAKE